MSIASRSITCAPDASYIRHVDAARVARLVRSGEPSAGVAGFHPTSDYALLSRCDAILICVPTPLTENREPDLSYVCATAETIAEHLHRGQLVVLESTTYPGHHRRGRPAHPRADRPARRRAISISPFRRSGRTRTTATSSTRTIPKLVGGVDSGVRRAWRRRCTAPSSRASSRSPAPTSPKRPSCSKTSTAASTSPWSTSSRCSSTGWGSTSGRSSTRRRRSPSASRPSIPGPGLGGHCIPIDPFYLTWKARQYELTTRFIELAGEVNHAMPGVRGRAARRRPQRARPESQAAPDPDPRRRLQARPRRRPRVARLQAHGAAPPQARRVALPRPLRPRAPPVAALRLSPFLGRADPRRARGERTPWSSSPTIPTSTTTCVVEHSRLVVDTRNATRGVDCRAREDRSRLSWPPLFV